MLLWSSVLPLETISKPTVESVIDSIHAFDGSVEEYHNMFVAKRISHKERESALVRLLLQFIEDSLRKMELILLRFLLHLLKVLS